MDWKNILVGATIAVLIVVVLAKFTNVLTKTSSLDESEYLDETI